MRNETRANDSAFPANGVTDALTKREYFAALAMQGMLANGDAGRNDESAYQALADSSLMAADALIKALNE